MNDLISRAEALNFVKDVCEAILSRCGSHYDGEDEVFDDLLEADAILKCNKEIRTALKHMLSAQQWIPCTPETMPENEQDVLVTVEVRPFGRKPYRRVVRAFYTDGKHTDADSEYSWDEFPDPQYDDDVNMIIPEGWWESSDYCEQQGMVDDFVVAWMPLPEIILDWAEKNPAKTNAKKFADVFGFPYDGRFLANDAVLKWLGEEYR